VGSLGFQEIALIAVIALFVLGPDRLPQAARSIGKAISEFKRMTSGARADLEEALDSTGVRETIAEIRGTVDEMNPRRIVADSIRTVETAGPTKTAHPGYDSVVLPAVDHQTSGSSVPPPDADVARNEDAPARASLSYAVDVPSYSSGFKDILEDDA
jgi:sec-independent protein translocase protein TatB